jgi:catechol 2,3-dioxygenase-like lactoylglutathione lyase family enzyme
MKIKDFTTGVQHIGIPTNDINKTIEFYHALGFETALRTVNGTEEVAFLQLHNLIIETYQNHQAKMEYGAVDHIAIDVKNIDDLFQVVKEAGTFKMLDQQVNGLPFWENGVKFFTIEGPNKEKIEFCARSATTRRAIAVSAAERRVSQWQT